jgi:hypothetical protein
MTTTPSWVPDDVDLSSPNVARIYDYYLGGAHNFAIDREFAKKAIAIMPDVRPLCALNRLFLRKAVRYLVQQGVRQFIDIGSGIPTVGSTHETAQELAPDARVVYVDNEAVAVAHSELILQGNDQAAVLRADALDPASILDSSVTRRLIDFDQPVGIIMLALLHFVPDERDPIGLLRTYRDAVVPGSYLAMSGVTSDIYPDEMERFADLYRNGSTPLITRSKVEWTGLFTGWELVEPGVSALGAWHRDPETVVPEGHADDLGYGGLARKV